VAFCVGPNIFEETNVGFMSRIARTRAKHYSVEAEEELSNINTEVLLNVCIDTDDSNMRRFNTAVEQGDDVPGEGIVSINE